MTSEMTIVKVVGLFAKNPDVFLLCHEQEQTWFFIRLRIRFCSEIFPKKKKMMNRQLMREGRRTLEDGISQTYTQPSHFTRIAYLISYPSKQVHQFLTWVWLMQFTVRPAKNR